MAESFRALLVRDVLHSDPSGRSVMTTELVRVGITMIDTPAETEGAYVRAGDWRLVVVPDPCRKGHHANCWCDKEQSNG